MLSRHWKSGGPWETWMRHWSVPPCLIALWPSYGLVSRPREGSQLDGEEKALALRLTDVGSGLVILHLFPRHYRIAGIDFTMRQGYNRAGASAASQMAPRWQFGTPWSLEYLKPVDPKPQTIFWPKTVWNKWQSRVLWSCASKTPYRRYTRPNDSC